MKKALQFAGLSCKYINSYCLLINDEFLNGMTIAAL